MTGSSRAIYPQVSIIGSVVNKPLQQSCSNLIKDQQVSSQMSDASPISSFMPSNPSLDRTSPEGRSCGDIDPDAAACLDDDNESAEVSQTMEKDNNEKCLEEVTSISSYFNFQTPTSHLSQNQNSYQEDKTGEMFGEIGLRFIDSSAVEEDIEVNGEETSVSSFSTFYSQEDVSWVGDDKLEDMKENIALEADWD